jgi:hypothetical protein
LPSHLSLSSRDFGRQPIVPSEDEVLARLREAFCDEVLSLDCAEWRLRRVVVLRWASSWYSQAGISALPDGLRLPALDDD